MPMACEITHFNGDKYALQSSYHNCDELPQHVAIIFCYWYWAPI